MVEGILYVLRTNLHQEGANPAGGQSAQAIGRTKGGLNTKLLAIVDSYGRAVALNVHAETRNDVRTMDEHACLFRGRTLDADRGFDADGLRAHVAAFGGRTCIPAAKNVAANEPSSRRLYRRRHRVENFWVASSVITDAAPAMVNSGSRSWPSFSSRPSSIG